MHFELLMTINSLTTYIYISPTGVRWWTKNLCQILTTKFCTCGKFLLCVDTYTNIYRWVYMWFVCHASLIWAFSNVFCSIEAAFCCGHCSLLMVSFLFTYCWEITFLFWAHICFSYVFKANLAIECCSLFNRLLALLFFFQVGEAGTY